MEWIRRNLKFLVPAAVVLVLLGAYLAFGVFGIQTLFVDDEVDEAVPVFESGAGASGLESDAMTQEEVDEMNAAMQDEQTPAEAVVTESVPDMEPEVDDPAMNDVLQVVSLYDGVFVPRSHPGEGTASILNDGTEQRFLRFEDFATDNGPDLNVYLTRVSADADAGAFDDDFVDLGDLKGHIGPQTYEIPSDVDLDEYGTVVVWCVRFGVAFTAADLVPSDA